MGRPSKAEEKRQIILDAYEAVILRDGYAKASQRKVAVEAGMNQPMIHHYFSGGNDMLDALLQRVVDRYMAALDSFASSVEEPSLEQAISFTCSEEFHAVSKQNEVFFCLIGQGGHNQRVYKKMSSVYELFFAQIVEYLEKAKVKNSQKTGYLIMCLIIGHDWAKKLGFGELRNQDMFENLMKISKI